ncbi:MAG: DUF424 family protein [Candidatus Methanomethylophilaceae archaeon]|nr:DUF424 family protein [Candidatus Methanomethylophilaceae archaeon]
MFMVKIHRGPNGSVLAVCDESILGMTFSEGKISLHVSEGFYGGDSVSEEIMVEHFNRASSINIVGNEAVSVAIREGFVDADKILVIDGVRHAQVLR